MKKISKYQIFTELQHGPITRIYKAVQPELQRMVLVKQLNPDRIKDSELVERFKQEGSILAKINSPNVITIFDFGYEPDDNTWNKVAETVESYTSMDDIDKIIKKMESEMQQAAKALEFEKAAELRDQIKELQKLIVLEI